MRLSSATDMPLSLEDRTHLCDSHVAQIGQEAISLSRQQDAYSEAKSCRTTKRNTVRGICLAEIIITGKLKPRRGERHFILKLSIARLTKSRLMKNFRAKNGQLYSGGELFRRESCLLIGIFFLI